MALRTARGLFRLWLVFSVLWIGGVGVVTWWTFPSDELPVSWSIILDRGAPSWAVGTREEAVRSATLLALIPPALLLAFGSALVWAFRGFR
jgi:hypothetical protein